MQVFYVSIAEEVVTLNHPLIEEMLKLGQPIDNAAPMEKLDSLGSSLPTTVSAFLTYLRKIRRCSDHTIVAYGNDLKQCVDFLSKTQSKPSLPDADRNALRAFVLSCMEQKMKPRTINRKIAALKSFYTYLLRHDLSRDTNPALSLKTLKVSSVLPSVAKEGDMDLLFDRVAFGDDFAGQRDKLVLLLLYGAGLRRAELLALQEADLDLYSCSLRVLGKRNKVRIIPLPKPFVHELKTYLQLKHEACPETTTTHLFLDNEGRPLYPMWLYRHVKKHLSRATHLQRKSPHVLRHTYATHLLDRGADLNAIKELMGHSSLAATQVYTHTTIQKIKEVYKKAHPKA